MGKQYKIIWKPQPKQKLALSCPATELFFGGAAGGGKSDFMLADFLQQANKYGRHCKGILFRQTVSELEELQNRAEELYKPLGAVYKGTGTKTGSNLWLFPNGATLKMRYLEREAQVKRYQGHQYTWIGIDELGNYPTPYCWTFMKSRLRSPVGVPCYIRGSANPGGVGHAWIKQRFMDGHEPNQIFYLESEGDSGKVFRDTACFIPSRLEDNTILMKNDPQYEARLLSLPAHLARAMRYGDWSVFDGQIFDVYNPAKHFVKPFNLELGVWFKFAAMDWGWSHPFSIGWYAVNSQGVLVRYRSWYGCQNGEFNTGIKMPSTEVARKAWELSCTEGVTDMVADPAIWAPNQQVKDGKTIAEDFEEVGFKMTKGNNDRINGLVQVYNYLATDADNKGTPMFRCFSTCKEFDRIIPMLTPDPNNMEDVDTRLEDHPYDELRYAIMSPWVKNPSTVIEKINGRWQIQTESSGEYNPLDNI